MAVNQLNLARLDSLCGGCGLTMEVVQFLRGFAPDGKLRTRQLGAMLGSAPLVVQGEAFGLPAGSLAGSLVWVGTSDGTVRAFAADNGAEMLCLIPPDQLDHQVRLFQRYLAGPEAAPVGQSPLASAHEYGMNSPLGLAEMTGRDGLSTSTVLLISEGPGGTGLHAVDISSTRGWAKAGGERGELSDQAPLLEDPVTVLWSWTADGEAGTGALPFLGDTWSVPAVAADEL